MTSSANVLVVVAHPDDEVLGAGGTIAKLTDAGVSVTTLILCGSVEMRSARPDDDHLRSDLLDAAKILGTNEPILGDFPNIQMNTVPHVQLVQFIEKHLEQTGASTVFTHHPSDLNDDHRQVSAACQAAARLGQRRPGSHRLHSLYFMEVLSSTDWAFPGAAPAFQAITFSSLAASHADRKHRALAAYRDVMRPFPHPRSDEALDALLKHRGAQAGFEFAEAFQPAYTELLGGLQ